MNIEHHPALSCTKCICRTCLLWWSGRCPHGGCYDDLRAKEKPWDKTHPNNPPRQSWGNWKEEQAFWCRGGVFYTTSTCEHYEKLIEEGTNVRGCLGCNITQFQDGHINCSLIDTMGCEECYRRFAEKEKEEDK